MALSPRDETPQFSESLSLTAPPRVSQLESQLSKILGPEVFGRAKVSEGKAFERGGWGPTRHGRRTFSTSAESSHVAAKRGWEAERLRG